MKSYEYKVENKNCSRDFKRGSVQEASYLKQHGDWGWELCGIISENPATTIDSTTYYWKVIKNNI